jgi:hypothetical protein
MSLYFITHPPLDFLGLVDAKILFILSLDTGRRRNGDVEFVWTIVASFAHISGFNRTVPVVLQDSKIG